MKKFFLRLTCALVIIALLTSFLPHIINLFAPEYNDAVGNGSDDKKIQGLYILKQSAKQSDNIIIYGSSELRTDYISTHPSNFFAGKRCGFQVNLVGRGSCQSIIHALSIAASGDSLKNSKVVLITSPQSYVPGGITPDMFFANFSKQQYLTLMSDKSVGDDIKQRFNDRLLQMFNKYDEAFGKLDGFDEIRIYAENYDNNNVVSKIKSGFFTPFFSIEKMFCNCKDSVGSFALINNTEKQEKSTLPAEINWQEEEKKATAEAENQTHSNDFGMRDADYMKNVGNHPEKYKDKEKNLSYSDSVEYFDLKLLLDVCKEKGIKPLFVSVPLNGSWSDFTGFSADKRKQYYDKVNSVVSEYGFDILDLTSYEYDKYFLCDTMHLGWKGWLKVDEALVELYNRNLQ